MVRGTSVPERILTWSRLARQHEDDEENSESELSEIIARYCNLQTEIKSQMADEDRVSILEKALDIDVELTDWAVNHQITNLYTTLNLTEPSEEVFSNHWHIYRDAGLATISNYYRSTRILINQMLIIHLGLLPDVSSTPDNLTVPFLMTCADQVESSRQTIVELAHDICASVPYFLGSSALCPHTITRPANIRARGKLMLWPLYVAGQTEYVPNATRDWVVGRMDILADMAGLRKAQILARMLRSGVRSRKVWREQVPEEAWYSKDVLRNETHVV